VTTLYTYGGTPADVLTDASGNAVTSYQVLVYRAGTDELITALYEADGTTPIAELRSNPTGSDTPGAIRTFRVTDVTAIELAYNGVSGVVRWYEAAREIAAEASAAAADALSRTSGGTVAGPVTLAGGGTVQDGLAVEGGASLDGLDVDGDASFTGVVDAPLLQLSGMRIFNPRVYGAKGDGSHDDAPAIQAALSAALAAGGGWVLVPSGTYLIGATLRIYRNTRLTLMPGAVFRRNVAATLLLNGDADQNYGAYSGHGNILIEGGTWDMRGTTAGLTASAMCISIGHAEHVTVQGITVLDVPGYHGVELNSTKDGRILDCSFLGYVDPGGRDYSEACQIDLAKSVAEFGGYGPYDQTPCEDILVQGCYFGPSGTPGTTAWPRGIGSHSTTIGVYHRRIRIAECSFEGLLEYAVVIYSYEDTTIEGCTFTGCGSGVRIRAVIVGDGTTSDTVNVAGVQTGAGQDMHGVTVTGNTFRAMGAYDDAVLTYGETTGMVYDVTISGNTIDTTNAQNISVTSQPNGIRLFNTVRATVNGNVINAAANSGVSTQNVTEATFTGNTVDSSAAHGMTFVTDSAITATGNTVRTSGGNGVLVQGGSTIQLRGNDITGSSRSSSGTYYGIRASTSADSLLVTGNKVRKYGSGAEAAYGLSITSTCTNVKRYGNDLVSSGTSGPLDDESTGATVSAQDVLTAISGRPALATAGNTTSETVVATWTIPAGDALQGVAYRFTAQGTASSTGTPTLTIRVRLGGTSGAVIAAFSAVTTSSGISGRGWRVDGSLYSVTTGSSATWAGGANLTHHLAATTGAVLQELTDGTVTKDSTTDQTLVVTAQWSAASTSTTTTAVAGQLHRNAA
jgi:hypothetical protein